VSLSTLKSEQDMLQGPPRRTQIMQYDLSALDDQTFGEIRNLTQGGIVMGAQGASAVGMSNFLGIGGSAAASLVQSAPDVILMDIQSGFGPTINGLDAIRAIREARDVKVFVLGPSDVGIGVGSTVDVRRMPTAFAGTDANELEKLYVFEDRRAVNAFIVEHRLRGLLAAALEPLNEAFGDASLKTLKIATDDEGSQTLFCLVQVVASVEDAHWSLAAFDERWWLPRCGAVAGKLNFDFELV
jgi:hypothetical protein